MEFSFSGSGLLLIYQLGVARTLQLANLHNPETCARATGSSGGSLVAAALILDANIEALKNFKLMAMKHLRSNPTVNTFKFKHYIRGAFNLLKTLEWDKNKRYPVHVDAIKNERLAISVTGIADMSNHLISTFEEQHQLEEALLASAAISPLGGYPFRLDRKGDERLHGKLVIDGGLTVVQPKTLEDAKVITISPFVQWQTDIAPSKPISLLWIVAPPDTDKLEDLYNLGMMDALNYVNTPEVSERFQKLAKTEKIILGEELRELVSATIAKESFENYMKNPIYENREDTNFEFLIRVSEEEQEVIQHKALQLTAFAATCTQYAFLGAFNLTRSVIVGIESKRRLIVPQSQWLLSLRKWLPDSQIGTVEDSLTSSVSNFKQLMDPMSIWNTVTKALAEGIHPDSPSKVAFETDLDSVSTIDLVDKIDSRS